MKHLFSLILFLINCCFFNNVKAQNQDAIIANVGNDFYTEKYLVCLYGQIKTILNIKFQLY